MEKKKYTIWTSGNLEQTTFWVKISQMNLLMHIQGQINVKDNNGKKISYYKTSIKTQRQY